MTAAELRKKLDEGLRADSSGRSTPIQRLTPFLHDLVTYLEEREISPLDIFQQPAEPAQVSSDDARQVVPALPTHESVGASKATAQPAAVEAQVNEQALGKALEPLPANRNAAE